MEGVQKQIFSVLVFIVSGILLGMVFDLIRGFRNNWKLPKVVKLCMDILYWIFAFFLLATVLLVVNWGEIRGYVFLSTGIGILIYFFWISPSVLAGYLVLFCVSEKIVYKFCNLLQPIVKLFSNMIKKE